MILIINSQGKRMKNGKFFLLLSLLSIGAAISAMNRNKEITAAMSQMNIGTQPMDIEEPVGIYAQFNQLSEKYHNLTRNNRSEAQNLINLAKDFEQLGQIAQVESAMLYHRCFKFARQLRHMVNNNF